MSERLRVLVVDDSPLFLEALCAVLEEDPSLEIVGIAKDGAEAVRAAQRIRPDVITMDIHMPVLDGLSAVERIMSTAPTPILVVTADPRLNASGPINFEAIRRGALDVVPKPMAWSMSPAEKSDFCRYLRLLSEVSVVHHVRRRRNTEQALAAHGWNKRSGRGATARALQTEDEPAQPEPAADSGPAAPKRAVAIVASTGGPAACAYILEALPATFPAAILVVQHIAPGFAPSLASWLRSVASCDVRLATDGAALEPGVVFIAPDEQHMTVGRRGRVVLDASPALDGHRPSGTRLLQSVAEAYGARGIGVVLTGMGRDGVKGLRALRSAGGFTIAQDETSSVVYGMPKLAYESGAAKVSLPLAGIALALREHAGLHEGTPRRRQR